MNQTIEHKTSRKGSTEAVKFSDGMLVTAEDLGAAMRYPLAVVQVLLRSYFGCGIVCGLELENLGADSGKPRHANKAPEAGFVLQIGRGVALGCDGYPIELCEPVKLDLRPDPCRCGPPPTELYIAIRRFTDVEAPPTRECGCGTSGQEPDQQCNRLRDHVLVQAFEKDDLPRGVCRHDEPEPGRGDVDATGAEVVVEGVCACMKQCPECDCSGEPWVLLGIVTLNPQGITEAAPGGRRDVKPIACICNAETPAVEGANQDVWEKIKELQRQIDVINGKGASTSTPDTATVTVPEPAKKKDKPGETETTPT